MSDIDLQSDAPRDSVARGIGLGCLLQLSQFILVPLLTAIANFLGELFTEQSISPLLFTIGGWSVTQFLYILPAAWIYRRRGFPEKAKGILIVAALCILLNGACDALMFSTRLVFR